MPVRIDVEYLRVLEDIFFESQCAAEATWTANVTSGLHIQDEQSCASKFQPQDYSSLPLKTFSSPVTSTTTADCGWTTDFPISEFDDCSADNLAFKDGEDRYDAEDHESPSFIPFVDPLDWDHVADGDRRFSVASELVDVLSNHGGQLLLSKVGSMLTDEARLALRETRIRLLTFLKEKPQKKYFRIEGAGGGQVLSLRDLRDPAAGDDTPSLDGVRAELREILAPCRRKNALLLRSLGSSLSHSAKASLKVHHLSLSQFLALDKRFVVRKSHVYLAEP
jgi:hypothetical protein